MEMLSLKSSETIWRLIELFFDICHATQSLPAFCILKLIEITKLSLFYSMKKSLKGFHLRFHPF
jgi:hypothetical protein